MGTSRDRQFVLPGQTEILLASAAAYLKQKGELQLVELLANGRWTLDEEVDYDNWDGGQSGHGLRIHVPEALFHKRLDKVQHWADELRSLLNNLASVPREHFAEVEFCLDLDGVDEDWRESSGLVVARRSLTSSTSADQVRLWGDGSPRVFLSHRAAFKIEAKALKTELQHYGAAAFVAHEDIEPSKAWQREIERALDTMHVLVALLSAGFTESAWANQEVGVAFGRGVPMVAVRVDEDPPGFIGSIQAVPGHGRPAAEWAEGIVSILSGDERLTRQMQAGLVRRWENASSFSEAIDVMVRLDAQKAMPQDLVERIEAAYARNDQLYKSAGVGKHYPDFLERMKRSDL